MPKRRSTSRSCLVAAAFAVLATASAWTLVAAPPAAARSVSLIRDAEIETTIRAYGAPLFREAGLDAEAVEVHLVKERGLNAFVAGGQNIFLNTGLILASDTPNQLIGVIAHETGHISGGHLARTQEALRGASAQTIVAMVLGAAAIVAGQGNAGAGVIIGGSEIARRSVLSYSRIQEGAADQAGLGFLERTEQSAVGLLQFFEKLGDQEALLSSSQDPYVRSHPLTRERMDAIGAHIARSQFSDRADPPAFVEMHRRMKAKLTGFLESPVTTMRIYPPADDSTAAHYARAIAWHRQNRTADAIGVIATLLQREPDNPFFHELHGQVLLESGAIEQAVAPYERAVAALPNSILLRIALGQAQVSVEDGRHIPAALENLRYAVRQEPRNPAAWRWLAMAHGRDGDVGRASLATAERYFLIARYKDAELQAERARRTLPAGSPGALRALDIKHAAEQALNRER